MKSLKTIYKIGNGPSSSHTVGPYNAACMFAERYPEAKEIHVTLYGSLALTGSGHGTMRAITQIIPDAVISCDTVTKDLPHPNTMDFEALDDNGNVLGTVRYLSVGGGTIRTDGDVHHDEDDVYPEHNFTEIMRTCRDKGLLLADYILEREGAELYAHLSDVWDAMSASVARGLATEGILPGSLHLQRKAKRLYHMRCYNENHDVAMNRIIASYAYAVSEENAAENVVVTAPTCGSCGVVPAVFYYMEHDRGFPRNEILRALSVAGLIGTIIRENASISGAECGCQAEIGSACSMAAAGLASLFGLSNAQVEYAAEIAMEHNLGLTCDPVEGLVQIPCIERNAVACMRSISSVNLSRFLYETRKISFDDVVATMYETGKDMHSKYRETAHGGLAAIYKKHERADV